MKREFILVTMPTIHEGRKRIGVRCSENETSRLVAEYDPEYIQDVIKYLGLLIENTTIIRTLSPGHN